MTGQAFLDTLSAKIAPATINTQQSMSQGVLFTLSDGRAIVATRKRIKDCANQAELDAYVTELLV